MKSNLCKLNYLSKTLLLAHRQDFNLSQINNDTSNPDKYLYSYFLINNQYLNLLFKNIDDFLVSNDVYEISLFIKIKNVPKRITFTNHFLISMICLAKVNSLKICIYNSSNNVSKEKIGKWIRICVKMRENKCLKEIEVIVHNSIHIETRIFCDLLCSKIKTVFDYSDGHNCLENIYFGSKFQINQLDVYRQEIDPNILTKVKTRKLVLCKNCDILSGFSKCGRLKPNLCLKNMEIGFQLGFDEETLNNTSIELASNFWKNTTLPVYKKSLEVLEMINPDLELRFYFDYFVEEIEDFDTVFSICVEIIENVKLFIDMSKELETKIGRIEIDFTSNVDDFYSSFVVDLAKKLNLKHSDDKIDDILWHNGVEVKIDFYIGEYDWDFFNSYGGLPDR